MRQKNLTGRQSLEKEDFHKEEQTDKCTGTHKQKFMSSFFDRQYMSALTRVSLSHYRPFFLVYAHTPFVSSIKLTVNSIKSLFRLPNGCFSYANGWKQHFIH